MREDITSCSQMLYEWVVENGIEADPQRISKIDDEARRRWSHKMSNIRISQIVRTTLKKMSDNV